MRYARRILCRNRSDYNSSSARESFSEASLLTKADRTLNLILISSIFRGSKVAFSRIDSSLLKESVRHDRKLSSEGDGVKGVPFKFLGNIVV